MSNISRKPTVIAIVDDDAAFRHILATQIAQFDATLKILQFEDGYHALEYLLHNKEATEALPDTIFLDLGMKQVDGWIFLQEYSAIKKYLPLAISIHIITGSEKESDKLKALSDKNVTNYFVKPIVESHLKTALSSALQV